MTTIIIHDSLLAQDISTHKWKDRVLIILANEGGYDQLHQQIDILQDDPEGLKDRKLVIYTIKENMYRAGINAQQWIYRSDNFKEFEDSEDNFRVILVGLDGGIKINQNELISLDQLFSTIDAMPMRRNELRVRNQ